MKSHTCIVNRQPISSHSRLDWLVQIAAKISRDFHHKFINGEREHGGDIGHVPTEKLITELYQEQLDSLAYLAELKRRVESASRDVVISQDLLRQLLEIINKRIIIGTLTPVDQAIVVAASHLLTPNINEPIQTTAA